MLQPFFVSTIIALFSTAVGLPLAAARATSRRSAATLLFDSLVAGLLITITTISVAGWLGWVAAIVLVVAIYALAAAEIRHLGPIRLPALRPALTAFTGAAGAIVAVAVVIRLRNVDFLPWTGDMGNYVNAANRFADTGRLELGFPPGFAAFLSLPATLFGPGGTTASVPLLGAVLLGALLRITGQLRLHPAARLAALAICGGSTLAVWYSSFPLSEALQAPLVLVLFSAVLATVASATPRRPWGDAGELGHLVLVSLVLGLSRGTGPVLLIPVGLLFLATLHPGWRQRTRPVAGAVSAATLGLAVSYVYGVVHIPRYYVQAQIETILPGAVFRAMDRLGLFELSPQLVVLLAVALVAAPVVAVLVGRTTARRNGGVGGARPDPAWPLPLTVALAAGAMVVMAMEGREEIWNQLGRIGPILVLCGLVGLVLPRAVRGDRGPAAVLAGSTALVILVIQSSRFAGPMAHAYYLYWDRYLFSEVFPAALVLAALTMSSAIEWAGDRIGAQDPGRAVASGRARWAPVVASVAVLGLAGVYVASQARGTRIVLERTTVSGAVDLLDSVDRLMPDQERPIIWTGPRDGSSGWAFFPNSWFSFGMPMRLTYERRILNFDPERNPFEPDPVVDAGGVARQLACVDDHTAYVVEFSRTGGDLDARLAGSGLDVAHRGEVSARLPLLRQVNSVSWITMPVVADVWEVGAAPGTALPSCSRS